MNLFSAERRSFSSVFSASLARYIGRGRGRAVRAAGQEENEKKRPRRATLSLSCSRIDGSLAEASGGAPVALNRYRFGNFSNLSFFTTVQT